MEKCREVAKLAGTSLHSFSIFCIRLFLPCVILMVPVVFYPMQLKIFECGLWKELIFFLTFSTDSDFLFLPGHRRGKCSHYDLQTGKLCCQIHVMYSGSLTTVQKGALLHSAPL